MGNGGHIFDRVNFESGSLQGTNRRFPPGARSLHIYFNRTHAMLHGRLGCRFGRQLRGKRSRLAGPFKPDITGAGPGDAVSVGIGYADNGIVKGRPDMRDPVFNILPFTALRPCPFCLGQVSFVLPSLFLPVHADSFPGALAGPRVIFRSLPAHR